MKFYGITFFSDEAPLVSIIDDSSDSTKWDITLRINKEGGTLTSPRVTFYMTERQLVSFKNSVIASYNAYRREKDERAKASKVAEVEGDNEMLSVRRETAREMAKPLHSPT